MDSGSAAKSDLLWEALVTPGHVLAARLRWIEPKLFALGIALIIAGLSARLAYFSLFPPIDWDNPIAAAIRFEKAPVADAFAHIPPLVIRPGDEGRIPPGSQVDEVVTDALAELNRRDRLPSRFIVKAVTPESFWRKPWPINTLVVTSGSSVKLVAGVVTPRARYEGTALRWVGVFRKIGHRWAFVSLDDAPFVRLDGRPAVHAEDIPVTLGPVLPRSAMP